VKISSNKGSSGIGASFRIQVGNGLVINGILSMWQCCERLATACALQPSLLEGAI